MEFDAAGNEYDSEQLFITPKEDVNYFDLKLKDLISESGAVLSTANVSVYVQQYVELTMRTYNQSNRPLGWYPDALLPLDICKRFGENKVEANSNQGLWITYYIPKGTAAGTYRGEFTLVIDKEETSIPVECVVRNFTLSDEVHIRSTFNLFPETIIGGQLSNSKETYAELVDYLLDYRISTTEIAHTGLNLEDWVSQIKKYAADPRVTAYNVNSDDRLIALIENSTPELNLLDKAYIYLRDEPFDALEETKILHNKKIDWLIELANSYSTAQLKEYGLNRSDIQGIEVLVTMTASLGKIEGLRTYAPLVSDLHTQSLRDEYASYREEAYKGANCELEGTDYGTTWWYVCVHPYEPYPNYNIDMDLNSARVLSWMQYDYDVEGMLYWGTASYQNNLHLYDMEGFMNADVYNKANGVYPGANGDGYLVYPGAKYGLDTFLPTIRLENIRDGFQDYEYLYELERLATEYAAKYGVSDFSFNTVMRSIYDSLYTGTVAYTDYERVEEAKKTVADMIELLTGKVKAMIEIGEIDTVAKFVPINVYAKEGSRLYVGGTEVEGITSGEGVRFEYSMPVENGKNVFNARVTLGSDTYEISRFVTTGVKNVNACNDETDLSAFHTSKRANGDRHVTTSLNDDPAYIDSGNGSVKVLVEKREYTNYELLNYTPSVSLNKENFLGEDSFKDLDNITAKVYNAGESFNLNVALAASTNNIEKTKTIKSVRLSHGWNTIKISDLPSMSWVYKEYDMFEYVTGIFFRFPASAETDYEIYIDSIYYNYFSGESIRSGSIEYLRENIASTAVDTGWKAVTKGDQTIVTSFESYQEAISDMKFLNAFGSARFVDKYGKYMSGEKDVDYPLGTNVVTHGNYALKVDVSGDISTPYKPSVAIETKENGGSFDKYDFSDIDKVSLDVYNANDTAQNIYFQYLTDSVTGKKFTGLNKVTVPANTKQKVTFEIDRDFMSQLINLNQIVQLRIVFDAIEYGTPLKTFYLDNLTIYKTSEPIKDVKVRGESELESCDSAEYLACWNTIGQYQFFPSSLEFNDNPQYIHSGKGSFKLTNLTGYYINYDYYTVGWELSINNSDLSGINGISYWLYNAYNEPLTDFVRRTIREGGMDDSKDGLFNTMPSGEWVERRISKEELIELGFKMDNLNIFTLMFSVPTMDACNIYIDDITVY